MLSADASFLRIFIGGNDRYEKQLRYEWLIIQPKRRDWQGPQSSAD